MDSMDDPARQKYRGVLNYLGDMIEYARKLHRHDLVAEYQDAWETVAAAIFGELPARPERQTFQPSPGQPRAALTAYRSEMFSKPLRKIIGRMGDYELLECGHRFWQPTGFLFPDVNHKRRRCGECAKEKEQAKKPPSAATTRLGKAKDGTA